MNNEFIEVEVFEVYSDSSAIFETGLDCLPVDWKIRSLGNVTLSLSQVVSSELTTQIWRTHTYDLVTKRKWDLFRYTNYKVVENLKSHIQEVKLYKTTMSSGNEYLTKEKLIGANNE